MGKQESMGDWFQMAKDYAKAEKELKIENWVQSASATVTAINLSSYTPTTFRVRCTKEECG